MVDLDLVVGAVEVAMDGAVVVVVGVFLEVVEGELDLGQDEVVGLLSR